MPFSTVCCVVCLLGGIGNSTIAVTDGDLGIFDALKNDRKDIDKVFLQLYNAISDYTNV